MRTAVCHCYTRQVLPAEERLFRLDHAFCTLCNHLVQPDDTVLAGKSREDVLWPTRMGVSSQECVSDTWTGWKMQKMWSRTENCSKVRQDCCFHLLRAFILTGSVVSRCIVLWNSWENIGDDGLSVNSQLGHGIICIFAVGVSLSTQCCIIALEHFNDRKWALCSSVW